MVLVLAAVCVERTLRLKAPPRLSATPDAFGFDEAATAAHLAQALRFPTVSTQAGRADDAAYGAACDALHAWLERTYPKLSASLGRERVGAHALLFTWKGTTAAAPLILLAHQDVVPVDAPAKWTHAPFAGDVADGFVWGRGAIDDKVSLVGILEAVERLLERGFAPSRTLYLALGADEEIGGGDGAVRIAALLKERGVTPALLVDEGGAVVGGVIPGLARPLASVGIAEKGYASVRLTVTGPGGHSSQPPRQSNIGVLAAALARLEAHPMPASLRNVERMAPYLAPELPFGQRLALANLWLFGPFVERAFAANPTSDATLRTTTAVTMVSGGVKENVLPQSATAVVNFRVFPGDTVAGVVEHVRRVVGDERVDVELLTATLSEASRESSWTSPAFAAVEDAIARVWPEAVTAPGLVLGATDERHYAALGGDAYRFTPVSLERDDLPRIHGADERVPAGAPARAARFYAELVSAFAK